MCEHENEAPRPSRNGDEDDIMEKRKTFLEMSLKFRERTKGRVRITSEVLIREDRESGYREI